MGVATTTEDMTALFDATRLNKDFNGIDVLRDHCNAYIGTKSSTIPNIFRVLENSYFADQILSK